MHSIASPYWWFLSEADELMLARKARMSRPHDKRFSKSFGNILSPALSAASSMKRKKASSAIAKRETIFPSCSGVGMRIT